MATRVLVGMSGGVDSTAAALLLMEQGYEVGGITLWLTGDRPSPDAEDARRTAAALGIPHTILDLRETFHRRVIAAFGEAYIAGLTPNPCIDCNRHIKFGAMLEWALGNGYDAIATGHYARIDKQDGRYLLKKGLDPAKDQSYVLYSLTQHQLAHTLFPLGDLVKADLRPLVEGRGLIPPQKPESQDICFVSDGDYVGFLQRELQIAGTPGAFLDTDGQVIGTHKGVIAYTIGQRKGLGVAFGEPRFVVRKDARENTVTLGRASEVFAPALLAEQVNWIGGEPPAESLRLQVRTRYKQVESSATAYPLTDGGLRVEFDTPQRAITPGQAVVLYQGDTVVGGGTILTAL